MNIHEAFAHFLEVVAPQRYKINQYSSWKTRQKTGKITTEKMSELLLENGYRIERQERWECPDGERVFTIMYLETETGATWEMKLYTIRAENRESAKLSAQKAHPNGRKFTDVTDVDIDSVVRRVNDMLANPNTD